MVKTPTQSKTLKVTVSGSYTASDKEIESYDNVTGIIPRLRTEPAKGDKISKADQMIIRRYAVIWVGQARKKGADGKPTEEAKYKRVTRMRQVYIDSIEDNEDNPTAVLSYVGKNVMQMNFEELQDFAAANDLSGVPLYKVNSLAHARRVAWSEYARKVLKYVGPEFMWTNEEFNPHQHEPIIADDKIRMSGIHVASIDETLDREATRRSVKPEEQPADASTGSRLTFDQLKAIADEKKISFHKGISFDALYKKVYSAAA